MRIRSALPPPKTSVNIARKLSRIFSNVCVNISCVCVLMRLMTSSNCALALTKSSCCLLRKLIALLGFLVFLDRHQIHRPHFIDALLQRCDLLAQRASQSVAAPLAAISSGVSVCTFAGPSSAIGDRDAFAANVVEVEMIFLLDALAQVLHRHVLLRQFDFDRRSRCCCASVRSAALLAQIFLHAMMISSSCVCLLANQVRDLCVDLIAIVLQRFNLARESWISRSACFLAGDEERLISPRRCSINCANSRDAMVQRLLLLPKAKRKVAPRSPARLWFPSGLQWRCRAAAADLPAARASRSRPSC